MLRKLFLDHPRTVHETYGEHWYVANRFGVQMVLAGLGTMLHGFVPGLMTRTGSNMIRKLHGEMMRRQSQDSRQQDARPVYPAPDHPASVHPWLLEYEI